MANGKWSFDEQEITGSEGAVIRWDDDTFFTLEYQGKSFTGEILDEQLESNSLRLKINHREFVVKKKGPLDELIAALGLDKPKVRKLKELQAPMPGRIVNIAIEVGQAIEPGDEILSLEAMKMENVLKAEGIGIVKSIFIQNDQVVEKGQVMVEFD